MRPGIRLEGSLGNDVRRPVGAARAVISVRPKQYPAYVVGEEGSDLYNKYGSFAFWTSHRRINEDGTFVFESIPPGEVDVIVHGEGFVSKNGGQARNSNGPISLGVPQSFPLLEPVTRIEVANEPTATLVITVVTRSGEPVEGVTVHTGPNVIRMQTGYLGSIRPSSEAPFGIVAALPEVPKAYTGRTDIDGRVVLRDIPAVASSLLLDHPEFEVPLPSPQKGTMRDRLVRFQLSPGSVTKLSITLQRKGVDSLGED